MNWIYILVLCLATYYIVARYLEKHLENFDPSLVPVSSIVTLAKVAQKLVDGGGTLTNPGNLQIGVPGTGTTGNLRVTGTTTLDGATTVGSNLRVIGTTTVDGATTVGGNLTVTGTTTLKNVDINSQITLISNDAILNSISYPSKKNIIQAIRDLTRIANEGGETIIEFYQNKNIIIPIGNLTVAGATTLNSNLTVAGATTLNSNLYVKQPQYAQISLATPTTNYVFTVADSKIVSDASHTSDGLNLYSYTSKVSGSRILQIVPSTGASIQNDMSIYGNLNVTNNLTANSAQITSNLTVTGNILNKAAAFRVKFIAWSIVYLTVVNGAPVVSKNINITNNSDYWIECGNRLLSLETNKFLTHDGTNFSLEGMTGTKRQIVMLLADVGSGSPVPNNRYVFRQLDSDGFGIGDKGIKYASGSDGSYLGHDNGTNPKIDMVNSGSGNSYFIKVA